MLLLFMTIFFVDVYGAGHPEPSLLGCPGPIAAAAVAEARYW